MTENHDVEKFDLVEAGIGVVPGNMSDLLPENLFRGEGDFRDITVFFLRHADEKEDSSHETTGISPIGMSQITSTVDQITEKLNGVPRGVVLKFYTSPKEWAVQTATGIIKGLSEKIQSKDIPLGVKVLSADTDNPKPRERCSVTRDTKLTDKDRLNILKEWEVRRKFGGNVEFSSILLEWDRRGGLDLQTEGRRAIIERLISEISRLRKVGEKIPRQGDKILLFIITHNVYLEALLGQKAVGCQGIRIDLPLKKGQKPLVIGKDSKEEIDL